MKKFFELHEYTDNLKVKLDIWWEDVKRVRDIRTDDLS